jgi:hypothetical protein
MNKAGSRVFLSYARADQQQARKIADHLREAGYRVWDPEQEILPGSDWASQLTKALNSAEAVVVFISPDAMSSRQVSHEIEYALGARHLRGRLIPVVLRDTKDAPWILQSLEPLRYENPAKTGREIVRLLSEPVDVPQAKRSA